MITNPLPPYLSLNEIADQVKHKMSIHNISYGEVCELLKDNQAQLEMFKTLYNHRETAEGPQNLQALAENILHRI